MNATDYLNRSALYRKLVDGPYRESAGVYAAKMSKEGLGRQCTWRSLSLFRDLMDWHVGNGHAPQDLNEVHVYRFLEHRFEHWKPDSGDRSALRRLLLALREKGLIPAALPIQRSEHEKIVDVFGQYLSTERGLARRDSGEPQASVASISPGGVSFRRRRVCSAHPGDRYRLCRATCARRFPPKVAKAMCGVVRAFLRYLHLKGLISTALADCVPSIRRWRLAGLPTFLPAGEGAKVLDACDRTTAMGRRDYAVLMILAKLGLRASEVATLNLDDIDWQAGTILVHGKGRRQATMPLRHDVGTAIVAYIRHGRPASACRRVFLRTLAPHVGFASGCAITMIAKQALERAGIDGYAHHGAHLFRHSLATDLLRSGASFAEIGQLLRHRSIDSTRIYAKLDIEKLRELSLAWPGGVQ